MIHKMKLNESPFNRIKNGTKTVEFRLYDEKRKQIKVGDKIEFLKLPELKEKLVVEVLELYQDKTFENLFRKLYKDSEEEIERKTKSMYEIYSSDQEEQYGVKLGNSRTTFGLTNSPDLNNSEGYATRQALEARPSTLKVVRYHCN